MRRSCPAARPVRQGQLHRIGMESSHVEVLADALGVSAMRVSHLLKGDRPITAELALRLGRAFGQTPQYWLNLQSAYDLKVAQAEMKDSLKAVRALVAA